MFGFMFDDGFKSTVWCLYTVEIMIYIHLSKAGRDGPQWVDLPPPLLLPLLPQRHNDGWQDGQHGDGAVLGWAAEAAAQHDAWQLSWLWPLILTNLVSWLLTLVLVTLSLGSSWFLPLIHTLTYIDNKKLQTACVGDKIACKSILGKTILQLALTGDLLSCYSALVYMRQGKTPLC